MKKRASKAVLTALVALLLSLSIVTICITKAKETKAETFDTDGWTFKIPQYSPALSSEIASYLGDASSTYTALVDTNGNRICLSLEKTEGLSIISTTLWINYAYTYSTGNYSIYIRLYAGDYMSGSYYQITFVSPSASSGKIYVNPIIISSNSAYDGYPIGYLISKYGLVNKSFSSTNGDYTAGSVSDTYASSRPAYFILYRLFRPYNETDIYENGYQSGYEYGKEKGYEIGYEDGKNYGYELGYEDGYNNGLIDSNSAFSKYNNVLRVAWDGASQFLTTPVFGNLTILHLILLPLTLGVFIIIIKIIRG